MSKFSNYLETRIYDHIFRATASTAPTTVYVSLHSADPGETGASELSGGSYARVAMAFAASSDGVGSNSGVVTFPVATGNWSAATHFYIWDAVSGGNALIGAALTTSRTVLSGDTASFAVGALVLTIA